ncbi:MAG: protein translocase subunit SecF [Treponemataceae bacterium]
MKRTIQFNKTFLPAVIVSVVLIVLGMIGYVTKGGFNLGVDFQAGLIQEVQIAPTALEIVYTGKGVAAVAADSSKIAIVVSGAEVENTTYSFPFASYATLGALVEGLSKVPSLAVKTASDASIPATALLQSAQENPRLSADPYALHYLLPGAVPVPLEKVRAAVASIGGASVQFLGTAADRKFMIRIEDQGKESGFAKTTTEKIDSSLAKAFGAENLVINRTDYVGSRFSKNLTDQAALLLFLTLFVILVYCTIRFKTQFAIGAVLAILHDALIMVSFMAWSRMEFNTISIAAILTILGYSINDTIVIFDRIREDTRLYPDQTLTVVINRAISETLGRTIITTVTTLLAVFALFFFTTGSMKDFALALIVGMTSGIYSTIFIASAFVLFWDIQTKKRGVKLPKHAEVVEAKKA